ncbi:hypothetical protein H0266_18395 [Halobacillus locisalis]|uniref:Uncharacterized protein n=1 Tax=Halobacillus locisalis TaxID=220753 RepID=A0A838CY57_9BACI|nr:hypothetical protein [Halobacillus locisalis]MBA2176853.1 hypothetical protein [Halobacillus locisalis]
MARVFEASRAIFIPARGGHPKNAEYRVAVGYEQWETPVEVSKVQMVYNGGVAGMLSPSFPVGELDEKAVVFALELLKNRKYGTDSKTIKDVLVLEKVPEGTSIDSIIEKKLDELEEMTQSIFASKRKPQIVIADVDPVEHFELEDSVYAFLFRVQVSKSS